MAPEVTLTTSLDLKLEKIRSPKLENQQQKAVILSAVETTLREENTPFTPTAYFVALLALLNQSLPNATNEKAKELVAATVYLLDIVTDFTPPALLRSKFQQIVTVIAPLLTQQDIDAPLARSALGILESLLLAQDAAAWAIHQTQVSARAGTAILLKLAADGRPKVRKRALDALVKVLQNGPPSPSVDHPAADMCAQSALQSLSELAGAMDRIKKSRGQSGEAQHGPALMHALQLIKSVATASGGWPSKKIEELCELLLNISKSTNEYLSMATFDIFEIIFAGMATEMSFPKLARMIEIISELRPAQTDSQLLPPWIAVLTRGYIVSSQAEPDDTFQRLPEIFDLISSFMSSPSHNVRTAASECLVSLIANCIPDSVLLNPSVYDEKILEKVSRSAVGLLNVQYQAAWMEIFSVIASIFDALRWRSIPYMNEAINLIGGLRSNDSFNGKKEADVVLGSIVNAIGPENTLELLPLNLRKPQPGQPGRVWLLPILRDNVANTRLAHFRSEMVPLSEFMFQKVIDNGTSEKTMEIKIFETIVQQLWSTFPGYCDLPLDVIEAFDQSLAEQLANLLYSQVELRVDICKGLQALVDSNKAITAIEGDEDDLLLQRRVSKASARQNLKHIAGFAGNILAVLFNVYSQTLPQHRAYILKCINSYLSIITAKELMETFARVTSALETALLEEGPQTQAAKQKSKKTDGSMPPMSHTLIDLVITMAIYLPRESFGTLFNISALMIAKENDPQLQKKAYKLIPRLEESETGRVALKERISELQRLVIENAGKASPPCRRDRLTAIARIVQFLPDADLSFIPTIISEVVISCKETNEKARGAAFDLLVQMGHRMQQGGIIISSNIPGREESAPDVPATLEEYFMMISAGLADTTPHVISATVTALSRCLFEFRENLNESTISDMVSTLDLFLTSQNREIVRSVLGFVKVAVISLPKELVSPKLESLVPNLLRWSHEHKAQLKVKVKKLIERLVRRFGVEIVEKYTPEDDKKLIHNIRKTRDRQKRRKLGGGVNDESDVSDDGQQQRRSRGRFESEYDKAIYDSSSDDSEGSANGTNAHSANKKNRREKKNGTSRAYIVEDEDEPLDLLSSNALASVSSTKPLRQKPPRGGKKSKAKVNIDGKLVIGANDSDKDDDEMMEFDGQGKGMPKASETASRDAGGGVDAYVEAISGKHAVQRGQRGKLKFKKQGAGAGEEGGMDLDEDDGDGAEGVGKTAKAQIVSKKTRLDGEKISRGGARKAERWKGAGGRGGRFGSRPAGKKRDFKSARRGLGVPKVKAGRIGKSSRG